MAFTEKELIEIEKSADTFFEKRRPPKEMRDELDLAYRVEGHSIMVYEIRPSWNDPQEKIEEPVAKATFVRTQKHWKVFWMRADLKWHAYPPKPKVQTPSAFFYLVDKDEIACFFG